MDRNSVSNTSSVVTNDGWSSGATVDRLQIVGFGVVIVASCRRLRDPEDVRPLFNCLLEVVVME